MTSLSDTFRHDRLHALLAAQCRGDTDVAAVLAPLCVPPWQSHEVHHAVQTALRAAKPAIARQWWEQRADGVKVNPTWWEDALLPMTKGGSGQTPKGWLAVMTWLHEIGLSLVTADGPAVGHRYVNQPCTVLDVVLKHASLATLNLVVPSLLEWGAPEPNASVVLWTFTEHAKKQNEDAWSEQMVHPWLKGIIACHPTLSGWQDAARRMWDNPGLMALAIRLDEAATLEAEIPGGTGPSPRRPRL